MWPGVENCGFEHCPTLMYLEKRSMTKCLLCKQRRSGRWGEDDVDPRLIDPCWEDVDGIKFKGWGYHMPVLYSRFSVHSFFLFNRIVFSISMFCHGSVSASRGEGGQRINSVMACMSIASIKIHVGTPQPGNCQVPLSMLGCR